MFALCFETLAQISPGELTNAHSKLEGLSNCTKCHVLGGQVNNSKCLDCHTDVKQSINRNHGYHSTKDVKGKNCWNCHSEHHGRNFKIIKFDKKSFDHNSTGFQLTGKHALIQCEGCHKSIGRKNSFLGLDKKCTSCHEDYHQNTLEDNCSRCHNTVSFKPALAFNHNQAKFKLAGAHLNVECSKCHMKEKRNGHDFQRFTGLNFTNCTPCHKDIHQGKFGRECQKCHSISSFKNIKEKAFDHTKTGFQLAGKHASVSCRNCHLKGDYTRKLPYAKCSDCHLDFHKGEYVRAGFQHDCKDCHSVEGFKPSTFTIEQHNKLKFQLTGSHLAAPCQSCHLRENEWHFNIESSKCTNCHINVHGSELSFKFLGENRCEGCHSVESWNVVNFDHKQTQFELVEKHSEIKCKSCHYYSSVKQYRFVSTASECESCHKDIHYGQFEKGGKSDCLGCHTFSNWKPSGFNHEVTKFPLAGAHLNLPCASCHPVVQLSNAVYTKYRLAEFKCASCHRA